MTFHKVEQGSEAWLRARAGKPTASEFSKIITPRTGKKSTQAEKYMYRLIAERLLDRPIVGAITWDMERGSNLEAEAVADYELTNNVDTRPGGFCTIDNDRIGASPDRFVGDDGLLEIKCPSEAVHVGYLLGQGVHIDYYPQLMGQLWVTDRQWVDIYSYHPDLPAATVRVERADDWIKNLAVMVIDFSRQLDAKHKLIMEKHGLEPVIDPLELQPEDSLI